ncbi:DUF1428 domain-containing protein [Sandarakinorhabdus sp.]|uniref:DUF1428 domain-containing protein n=1 Tax=Sandarakinorhabdus sp. TaxID=1916663 RepID=UPI00286D8C52|nr:DUF1428 domain-containing protein [Sandarakinorhabdus sp.]
MYVDGILLAVPTANREAYHRHAAQAAAVFKEYGAVSLFECWGDDVPDGKINSMNSAVQRKPDETVVFSWIMWPDKATRDAGFAKVMTDPRLSSEANPMLFDGSRMIFGGFDVLLEV